MDNTKKPIKKQRLNVRTLIYIIHNNVQIEFQNMMWFYFLHRYIVGQYSCNIRVFTKKFRHFHFNH